MRGMHKVENLRYSEVDEFGSASLKLTQMMEDVEETRKPLSFVMENSSVDDSVMSNKIVTTTTSSSRANVLLDNLSVRANKRKRIADLDDEDDFEVRSKRMKAELKRQEKVAKKKQEKIVAKNLRRGAVFVSAGRRGVCVMKSAPGLDERKWIRQKREELEMIEETKREQIDTINTLFSTALEFDRSEVLDSAGNHKNSEVSEKMELDENSQVKEEIVEKKEGNLLDSIMEHTGRIILGACNKVSWYFPALRM